VVAGIEVGAEGRLGGQGVNQAPGSPPRCCYCNRFWAALSPCSLEQIGIAVLQGKTAAAINEILLVARPTNTVEPAMLEGSWNDEGRSGRARRLHCQSTSNSTKSTSPMAPPGSFLTAASPNKWLRFVDAQGCPAAQLGGAGVVRIARSRFAGGLGAPGRWIATSRPPTG